MRQSDRNGSSVMIVDSEPELRRWGRQMLERRGYRVLTAEGGYEALQVLEIERRVDLLFVDPALPAGDGLAMLAEIRRQRLPVRYVVFLKDRDDPEAWGREMPAGARFYLVKPMSREVFVNVVEYLIGPLGTEERRRLGESLEGTLKPAASPGLQEV